MRVSPLDGQEMGLQVEGTALVILRGMREGVPSFVLYGSEWALEFRPCVTRGQERRHGTAMARLL